MSVKTTQVLCDCGRDVVKVVLAQGRVRVLAYGRGGLIAWLFGREVFREERRSATHQIAVGLSRDFGLVALDDGFDPIMRAFVTAAVACGDLERLVALLEASSREVTGDDSFCMRGDASNLDVRVPSMPAAMSYY